MSAISLSGFAPRVLTTVDRSVRYRAGACALSRLRATFEITRVRSRLVSPGGHQISVRADHVVFLPDQNMRIVLGAIDEIPHRICLVPIDTGDGPRPSQRKAAVTLLTALTIIA